MNFQSFVILFAIVCFSACNESDDIYPKLDNYYSLSAIQCACKAYDIIPNQHQIKIDYDRNVLLVSNFGTEAVNRLLPDGEYTFQLEDNIVNLDGIDFLFTHTYLTINFDSATPGGDKNLPVFVFTRN
ncbi:MAG: hypothetical protein P1U56_25535 [Saprospiraceae bacterium]|nr:hypothetical protein [Saprospiraceae bacterium]